MKITFVELMKELKRPVSIDEALKMAIVIDTDILNNKDHFAWIDGLFLYD